MEVGGEVVLPEEDVGVDENDAESLVGLPFPSFACSSPYVDSRDDYCLDR